MASIGEAFYMLIRDGQGESHQGVGAAKIVGIGSWAARALQRSLGSLAHCEHLAGEARGG